MDGGTGILQALGVRFLGAGGKALANPPEYLADLESIDLSGLDQRILHCALTVLCDVENPCWVKKARQNFRPAKGSNQPDIKKLEAGLAKLRDVMFRQTGKDLATIKHGGAAGGVAAGLQGFLNANLVKGIDYFLDITGFEMLCKRQTLSLPVKAALTNKQCEARDHSGWR